MSNLVLTVKNDFPSFFSIFPGIPTGNLMNEKIWEDEARVSFLCSKLRDREANPLSYDNKVQFCKGYKFIDIILLLFIDIISL